MPAYEDDEEDYWDRDPMEDGDDEDEVEEGGGPEELEELIQQADELAELGEPRKALRLWRRQIERFIDDPNAQYAYAQAAFRLLEEEIVTEKWWVSDVELVSLFEESLSALEEAVTIDETHFNSWNLMGALYALRHNFESAIPCWEKSLEINPDQIDVKNDLEEARERG
ncbi:MAG: tetratricopeptide repeat protein [Candidatus Sumerlaeia bacterium]|nr:tetratricopeptide repeat protein [Candidatus Sumerlaeia bacterium]